MSLAKNKSWLKTKIDKYSKNADYLLERQILEITEKISIRIQELGWSKKDFAEKMGVSQALVTKLLNGTNNFTLKTLVKISQLLDFELNIDMACTKDQDIEWFALKDIDIYKNITIGFKEEKSFWIQGSHSNFEALQAGSFSTALKPNQTNTELN
jgi:transcriptional regulator with XRE-family HTH domain